MKTIDIDTFLFGAYVTIIAFEEGCSETGATDLDLGQIRVQYVEDADKALRFVQSYELLPDIDASLPVYAKDWTELTEEEAALVTETDERILDAMELLMEEDPDDLVIDAALEAVCNR